MSCRNIFTTEPQGSTLQFEEFDDQIGIPDLNVAAINRLVVTHNVYICSLTVHYNNKVGVTRGQTDGTLDIVCLDPGEYITEIEGTVQTHVITKISFVSSTGTRWGPYGVVADASTFTWKTDRPDMGLLYFTGRADTVIRRLSASFGSYTTLKQGESIVKYEKPLNPNLNLQGSAPVSKFTRNIMSRPITLLIGPDSVEFYVSKIALCTLPFFRAALDGEFKEAAEQRITMPEDETQGISALIEFLYTGSYTYVSSPSQQVESDVLPANLAEGLFHLGVYVTAFKYDCQDLAKASLSSFVSVLKQLKGIDVIRLCKAAYTKELQLPQVENDGCLVGFRSGLAELLKGVYITHREEMASTAAENPALIDDLLRLVVSG